MRIIDASNRRAVEALFARKEAADRTFERQVAAIVQKVRTGGDAALVRFAKKFDQLARPIEVTRDEMEEAAATVAADVRLAIRRPRATSPASPRDRSRSTSTSRWCRASRSSSASSRSRASAATCPADAFRSPRRC